MKNLLRRLMVLPLIAIALTSCEDDDDRFNGSPVGKLNIETLKGQISTPTTFALAGQKMDFTVTLPRTFSDTVSVQATAMSISGRRVRASVDVMPGDLTATGEIFSAGGTLFDSTFDLYLSGIALQTADPIGTHFLLTSDVLKIGTGSSAIPTQNSERLLVKLVWPFANSSTNTLQLRVDRPVGADATPSFSTGGKTHGIDVAGRSNPTESGNSISHNAGDYIFSIKATALFQQPVDLPYRLIIVYPDGTTDIYSGIYFGLTTTSPEISVAKINKSYQGSETIFTAENLIP